MKNLLSSSIKAGLKAGNKEYKKQYRGKRTRQINQPISETHPRLALFLFVLIMVGVTYILFFWSPFAS
jgi:hypothetical protein